MFTILTPFFLIISLYEPLFILLFSFHLLFIHFKVVSTKTENSKFNASPENKNKYILTSSSSSRSNSDSGSRLLSSSDSSSKTNTSDINDYYSDEYEEHTTFEGLGTEENDNVFKMAAKNAANFVQPATCKMTSKNLDRASSLDPLSKIHKFTPSYTGGNETVGCRIWHKSNVCQKVKLTAFEIASHISNLVEENNSKTSTLINFWLILVLIYNFLFSIFSVWSRIYIFRQNLDFLTIFGEWKWPVYDAFPVGLESLSYLMDMHQANNFQKYQKFIYLFNTVILKFTITTIYSFMLCIALTAYNSRLKFSKYFSKLTSARKAQRTFLPHFRLWKTKNIKIWLTLRSYLRKRGPQRSIDVIVSHCFMLTVGLLIPICVVLLNDNEVLYLLNSSTLSINSSTGRIFA